jgi:hypothetical protein
MIKVWANRWWLHAWDQHNSRSLGRAFDVRLGGQIGLHDANIGRLTDGSSEDRVAVERLTEFFLLVRDQEVGGSNPLAPTNSFSFQ